MKGIFPASCRLLGYFVPFVGVYVTVIVGICSVIDVYVRTSE